MSATTGLRGRFGTQGILRPGSRLRRSRVVDRSPDYTVYHPQVTHKLLLFVRGVNGYFNLQRQPLLNLSSEDSSVPRKFPSG